MHPAKSVIFFTTASGAGYGLLFFMVLGHLLGLVPKDQTIGLMGFGFGFGLITAGLLSSTFHLGHPERAWLALSQWRSSWLSREGVAALVTYFPFGIYGIWWCFMETESTLTLVILGAVGMLFALITVYCTAMIYASLKPVHAWCNSWVPACYQVFSLMSGAVLLSLILHVRGTPDQYVDVTALILLSMGLVMKLNYWKYLKNNKSTSTAETATGLGNFGKVSLLEAPHSQSNFLMQEMGFQIARKHATQLRNVALIACFMIPAIMFMMTILFLGPTFLGAVMIAIAAFSQMIGLYVERWLFFAEAKHTVMLYYGESRA